MIYSDTINKHNLSKMNIKDPSSDDTELDDMTVSPTSTWWSSRRSSFSSMSSYNSDHAKSNKSSKNVSGLDECELLKQRIELYDSVFNTMAHKVDTFLANHQQKQQLFISPSPLDIKNLQDLKEMVLILKNKESNDDQTITTQMLNYIENCIIISATQDKPKDNKRLIDAIDRLSKDLSQAKKQIKKLTRRTHTLTNQKNRMMQSYQKKLDKNTDDRVEAEQLLDEMRKEMETMLDELDQVKQERDQYRQQSMQLEIDLEQKATTGDDAQQALLRHAKARIAQLEQQSEDNEIKMQQLKHSFETSRKNAAETHRLQVAALASEKEELRSRLVKAEQIAAEHARSLEKHDVALEEALRRSVAEKERELARVKVELEKSQRHVDQMKTFYDKQLERELKAREDELKEQYDVRFRKQVDTFQLQVSREVRDMTSKVVELEVELESMERQHAVDVKSLEIMRQAQIKSDEILQNKIGSWKMTESTFEEKIASLEGRIISLEQEVLLLYSKNLEMAQQLGELEP
ncbi:hypothetical protein G6F70_003241 [Rhizopus microsporus]|uniref:Uncharacterized protein n=1 Tax=Rhizopus azygosporus TaxID=86630 RepID=A0A367JS21_RHIAZ|nr:hypothetical protein G6F71_000024 [Rhizopus microsporus]RCH92737.1 hypothetical protein CU097_012280 [Rhizopus azygosporus]KAG1201329.1 hypothetical protein G6F70_003241 [Rhizopus microsporus]KAG1215254.1 hypothetical protein G6F69_001202 [Rhizopus microsporus]KAG1237619.1 hypothetical protein G6F67_001088 [Rhizopus microsporus]